MENKINYTIVGSFVIILLSALIFGIIWLSSGFSSKSYDTYQIDMNEAVDGLDVGASVEYNGVVVGNVKTIALNKFNPQQVILLLNIEEGTPITVNTTATLMVQGITRISYIGLKNRSGDKTPLVAKPGERYPVIPTSPSLYVRLDNAITEFTYNFNKLSYQLNSFLDADNQRAFKDTLHNFDKITQSLANNSDQIPVLVKNSAQAMQTLNTQTLPLMQQILGNVDIASGNLLTASREIKQNPSILLRGQTPPPPGPGE